MSKEDLTKQVRAAANSAIDTTVTKRLDKKDQRQDKMEERLAKLEKEEPRLWLH